MKHSIFTKYHTHVDRKKNVPSFVRREDWERFVDICSTAKAQAKGVVEKAARQAMRCPHTSGRKGQGRVVNELVTQFPYFLIFHLFKNFICNRDVYF